jgi:hypothetical protein
MGTNALEGELFWEKSNRNKSDGRQGSGAPVWDVKLLRFKNLAGAGKNPPRQGLLRVL